MGKKGKGRRREKPTHYKARVEAAFKAFDTNEDGTISKDELAAVLCELDPAWTQEAVANLLSRLDMDSNGVLDLTEFIQWVFSSDLSGRVAVEAARQRTLTACEAVPSAKSRLGSALGDIRVAVHDMAGREIISDFGLFGDEQLLVLRHAAETVMKSAPGYRCKLLLAETVLADEDTAKSAGLDSGSVLTAVVTIEPGLQQFLEELEPNVVKLIRDEHEEEDDSGDDEDMVFRAFDKAEKTLRQVDQLGCFGEPPCSKPWRRSGAPNAGKRRVPGWSGPEALGPAVPIFAEWLKDPNPDMRQLACWCLGRVGVDALPLLPHLAAAAWDENSEALCAEATLALCLLATQAPDTVLPVLAELVCHDLVSVSKVVMDWLSYEGPSICYWRPMPGSREIALPHIKEAALKPLPHDYCRSKFYHAKYCTTFIAAQCLKKNYPDIFNSIREGLSDSDETSAIVGVATLAEDEEDDFREEQEEEEEEEEDEEEGEDAEIHEAFDSWRSPDHRLLYEYYPDEGGSFLKAVLPSCVDGEEEE